MYERQHCFVMVSKDLFTGLTVFGLILAATSVLFVLINFGNILYLFHVIPTIDTACSSEPHNTCKYGLQHAAVYGNRLSHYCTTEQRRVGEACTSDCFNTSVEGDLVCDSNATCVSTAPEKCLGYCDMTGDISSFTVTAHSDCEGKLTYRPFFVWDTVGASQVVQNQLFYSDYSGDCELGVCIWYATTLDVWASVISSANVYDNVHGIIRDPLFYLNNTNKACITYKIQHLDTNFTTQTFRQLYATDASINNNIIIMGTLIRYFYSCAGIDEDLFLNEDIIIPASKRAILSKTDAHSKFESMIGGDNVPKIRELMKNVVHGA